MVRSALHVCPAALHWTLTRLPDQLMCCRSNERYRYEASKHIDPLFLLFLGIHHQIIAYFHFTISWATHRYVWHLIICALLSSPSSAHEASHYCTFWLSSVGSQIYWWPSWDSPRIRKPFRSPGGLHTMLPQTDCGWWKIKVKELSLCQLVENYTH